MKDAPYDRRSIDPGAAFSTWAAGDGWKLRRFDWPQPSGRTARGSLLFANGRGDFIEKYLEPMAHWHARGWNVTSFDWRGQGASKGSIEGGHLDSFDALLADARALFAAWSAERSGPHVAIGHSMGGHLLLRTLAAGSHGLSAAILVAPMIGINSWPLPPAAGQLLAQTLCMLGWSRVPVWKGGVRKGASDWRRAEILTSCADRYADEHWWYARQPGYALGAPSWGWLAAAYRSIAQLTPAALGRIDLPVLLLGTDRDRLVSAGAIRWAAGALPNAALHMYPAAGHEILRESDPVRLDALRRIDAFLEEHAGA
jgi:lysophospholipase